MAETNETEPTVDDSEETEVTDEELAELLQGVFSTEPDSDIWSPHTLRFFGPANRAILVSGEIDEQVANALSSQIQELSVLDAEEPINVHINTVGGSVVDALAIYDMLRIVPNPIITIVNGSCMSAGLIIACAGDHRLTTPNSMYFYHQTVVQIMGVDSMHVMESQVGFYEWCNTTANEIMRKRIEMSEEDWSKHFGHSTSKYFGAKDAVRYGLATAIIDYSEKPEVILGAESEEE